MHYACVFVWILLLEYVAVCMCVWLFILKSVTEIEKHNKYNTQSQDTVNAQKEQGYVEKHTNTYHI